MDNASLEPSQLLDGSPFDRMVSMMFLAVGLIVLIQRGRRIGAYLKGSWPVLLYVSFCLVSIIWSDFPEVSFKRWIKSLGDLVMVLIIATDPEPIAALKRFLSRVGFILLPASIMLIKYFGDLGRGFDPYGMATNTGVTTDKNALGVVTFVLTLGALWRVSTTIPTMLGNKKPISSTRIPWRPSATSPPAPLFQESRKAPEAKADPNRRRHLLAQGALFASGILVLRLAHSATSVACLLLGSAVIFLTRLPAFRLRPSRLHTLVLSILVLGGLTMFLNGQGGVAHLLGRESNLTGRTDIWRAVIPMVPNPLVGAGFESFWLGSRLNTLWNLFPVFKVSEAHNGYIEVYLNLGWAGITLIALVLLNGYKRAVATYHSNPDLGGLLLAYILAGTIYSITEAGFRLLSAMWVFLLLAVVTAGGVSEVDALSTPSVQDSAPATSNPSPSYARGRFETLRSQR
jgi:exopolysaccharide production protein ExoQ